ncbi:MAG: oligosaccharide flippase family protein [Ardenticatenaceae bacterium]|nr:oligosaccharide flippase family protein [Ardenticatenaceae bacterium]
MAEENQQTSELDDLSSPSPRKEYSLRSAFVWGQVGRVLEISANIAYSIFVIRLLSPAEYGLYSIIWSIVNTSILFISLGMEESVTRYTQSILHREGHALGRFQRLFMRERVLISLAAGILIFLGAPLLSSWMQTPRILDSRWILSGLVFFFSIWNLFSSMYVANLRMRDYTFVRLVNQLLNLCFALAGFYWLGQRAEVALGGMIISFVIGNLLFLPLLLDRYHPSEKKKLKREPFDDQPVRRYGLSLWLTNLATYGLASQIDVLLIAGLLASQELVSFYNVPLIFLAKVTTVITGWQAIMLPATTRVFEMHGLSGLRTQFTLYMRVNLLLLFPLFAFIIGHASQLLVLLFREVYLPAAPNLVLMALFSAVSAAAAANIAQPFLYVLNRQNTVLVLRIAAGILNIVLDIIFIPFFGVMGAVLGTGISNLVVHSAELFLVIRAQAARIPWLFVFKTGICAAAALWPTLYLPGDGWFNLIADGLLYGLVFAVLAYLARLVRPDEIELISRAIPMVGTLFSRLGWRPK